MKLNEFQIFTTYSVIASITDYRDQKETHVLKLNETKMTRREIFKVQNV